MSRPVVDDVIAVLAEIRRRLEVSGSEPDVKELRQEAVRTIARIEVNARRFTNEVSAENSIHDACVRRLGHHDVAEFDHDVDDWLQGRPEALSEVVLAKVTTEDQRQRFAEVLGISGFQPMTLPEQAFTSAPAGRVERKISRIIRDTRLSNRVKELHNYECQLCGYTLSLANGSRYAEGCHIQPLGAPHNGPDILENIICLCPNHHVACDLGAIELAQGELRSVAGHDVDQRYIDYHNSIISGENNQG